MKIGLFSTSSIIAWGENKLPGDGILNFDKLVHNLLNANEISCIHVGQSISPVLGWGFPIILLHSRQELLSMFISRTREADYFGNDPSLLSDSW